MPEKISPETRSRIMAGIRGRDTKPELMMRRFRAKDGHLGISNDGCDGN